MEHLLHEEGGALRQHLLRGLLVFAIDYLAVAVHHLGDNDGDAHIAVGEHHSIGVDQLHKLNGRRAEREVLVVVVERVFDAKLAGEAHYAVGANLVAEIDSGGILTMLEGGAQQHIGTRPARLLELGTAGRRVLDIVARAPALFHSLAIDDALEGRACLVAGYDIVVVPGAEIDIAHPRFNMVGARLYNHEACL